MKHVNGTHPCPACKAKTETVHPSLASVHWEVIHPEFPDAHVSDGWRGELEQNQAYFDKKSKAKWPNSPHNKMDEDIPCSLAIDLFRLSEAGVGLWQYKFFENIAKHLKARGVPVRWGGDWNGNGIRDEKFIDGPHFEWAGPV